MKIGVNFAASAPFYQMRLLALLAALVLARAHISARLHLLVADMSAGQLERLGECFKRL